MWVASVADLAREHISQAIFAGKFKPGQQIKEEEVANLLGISRPPIREAFKTLEADGLIQKKPRRGMFVAEITEKDIWEVYTLKAELYEFAIELAFHKMKPEDLSKMGRILEAMADCVNSDSPNILAYQELNTNFHDVILDVAEHQRLKRIMFTLHNQVRAYSYQTLSDMNHLRRSFKYHQEILENFKAGNLLQSQRLTKEHVLIGLKQIEKFYGRSE